MSGAIIYLNILDAEMFAEKLAEARRGRENAIAFLHVVLSHLNDEAET